MVCRLKFLSKLFLDAGRHAVAKQRAVGHDHAAAPAGFERAHDELHKQQRRLAGAGGFGEVQLDAGFFLAAKGRVGDDDLVAVFVADFVERGFQAVVAADVGVFDAVQQQVHRPEQVGQRFLLDAEQGLVLQQDAGQRCSFAAVSDNHRLRPGSRPCRRPGRGRARPIAVRPGPR